MWIQYISNVYHGVWDPKTTYIWKKIIDYASSVDIVVTAEDGETILYWSKYYGVFPINVPFSALSWDSGNLIIKPDFTIISLTFHVIFALHSPTLTYVSSSPSTFTLNEI